MMKCIMSNNIFDIIIISLTVHALEFSNHIFPHLFGSMKQCEKLRNINNGKNAPRYHRSRALSIQSGKKLNKQKTKKNRRCMLFCMSIRHKCCCVTLFLLLSSTSNMYLS